MARKKHRITVGFVSLGCPKNTVDSERMLAEIAQAGFVITPESYNADVVVINTCAFIAPAQAESLEVIQEALACKADPKQRLSKVSCFLHLSISEIPVEGNSVNDNIPILPEFLVIFVVGWVSTRANQKLAGIGKLTLFNIFTQDIHYLPL